MVGSERNSARKARTSNFQFLRSSNLNTEMNVKVGGEEGGGGEGRRSDGSNQFVSTPSPQILSFEESMPASEKICEWKEVGTNT